MIHWYYSRGPERGGPVSAETLREMTENGELQPEDLVWKQGLAEWIPARRFKDLFQPPQLQQPAGSQTPALPQRQHDALDETRVAVAGAAGEPDVKMRTTWLSYGKDALGFAAAYAAYSILLGNAIPPIVWVTALLGLVAFGHECWARTTSNADDLVVRPRPIYAWLCVSALVVTHCAMLYVSTTSPQFVIRRVLRADADTQVGARSITEIVRRMEVVDLSGCPGDFAEAYVAHCNAWRASLAVEQEAITYDAQSSTTEAYAEVFLRGLMGDLFGPAREHIDAKSQFRREYVETVKRIRATYERVEETAARHAVVRVGGKW